MRKILIILFALGFCSSASARIHGNPSPQGIVALNLGQAFNNGTGSDFPFINFMKGWSAIPNTTAANVDHDLNVINNDGYPTASLNVALQGSFPLPPQPTSV